MGAWCIDGFMVHRLVHACLNGCMVHGLVHACLDGCMAHGWVDSILKLFQTRKTKVLVTRKTDPLVGNNNNNNNN